MDFVHATLSHKGRGAMNIGFFARGLLRTYLLKAS
jgi:hypothetical protein